MILKKTLNYQFKKFSLILALILIILELFLIN